MARQARWRGSFGCGHARFGPAWQGTAQRGGQGQAWQCEARRRKSQLGKADEHGWTRSGQSRLGQVRLGYGKGQARLGRARRDQSRRGTARQRWVSARSRQLRTVSGEARQGRSRQGRQCVWRGHVRSVGCFGAVGSGTARQRQSGRGKHWSWLGDRQRVALRSGCAVWQGRRAFGQTWWRIAVSFSSMRHYIFRVSLAHG